MTDFSDADKLKSLRRELAIRSKVYPDRVKRGVMTQQQADHEIEIMESIIVDYEERLARL